jgi:hypothetical protein
MVAIQGLDVYVAKQADNSRRYAEYAIPQSSPAHTGNPHDVYIEAVDGGRFAVMIEVTDQFHMEDAPHLEIEYGVDADPRVGIERYFY